MNRSLRIVMHDYGGHPFPLQLSRALAHRGHRILHLYFPQCLNPIAVDARDATPRLTIRGITVAGDFNKFSFVRRRFQEAEYGKKAAQAMREHAPDLIISSTTPIDAQRPISALCGEQRIPLVYWLQDILSRAMAAILPAKIPLLGAPIARYYKYLEQGILRRSDAVVAISAPFVEICVAMGVPADRCHVIENWAPIHEISPRERHNAWSDAHGLSDKRVLLYAGTLGFKHDPSLFERLAVHFRAQADIRVVVVSQGLGADWLRLRQQAGGLDNLVLLPYQAYGRLADVLASGDVLLAILEAEAGIFSVPSKILSYLCAGKPILLSMPATNLAAETVRRAAAGRVVAPGDTEALIRAAEAMLMDPVGSAQLGHNARCYAEKAFDIDSITDRFEAIFGSIT